MRWAPAPGTASTGRAGYAWTGCSTSTRVASGARARSSTGAASTRWPGCSAPSTAGAESAPGSVVQRVGRRDAGAVGRVGPVERAREAVELGAVGDAYDRLHRRRGQRAAAVAAQGQHGRPEQELVLRGVEVHVLAL